jgi:hypothetical protein
MPSELESSRRLGKVLAMFPLRKHDLLRLAIRDPVFHSLCEDLDDAHASLARFLLLSQTGERRELAEYRTVIAELEAEVRAYVASHGP